MEQEEGIQVVLDQETNTTVKSRGLNERVQEQITELEISNQENTPEQEEGIPEDSTELNGDIPEENGRDCEFVAGARPKIKEQVQGGQEEYSEPSDEVLTRNEESTGAGQDLFRGSVICCDQTVSQWPERSQLLNENGCSRQQERIYSQLIFFLCRAPFLKSWDQLDRLAEMLHKLKNCIYYNPVALVGVIVQVDPDPGLDAEQEARARRWLRCLLDGFFCCDLLLDHDGTEPEVQVQVAVYQSGQPERALEVKRAACQAIRAALKF
ncbi:hypothetical protein E2320_009157 [Naja naja]|nr:hypothetical protein E2320_009157 [Naja naja]